MATTETPRGLQRPDDKPVRITMPQGPRARYGDPFFPKVPFQAVFYIVGLFAMLLFLALASPAPLQDPADPLNHAAIDPKPEWYFMFLFQLLKYFSGPFVVVGTVIIPTILVLLLLGLPFYDRNWARKVTRRPIAVVSMTGGMLAVIFLMWGGFGFPKPTFFTTTGGVASSSGSGGTAAPNVPSISPAVQAIFTAHCQSCHLNGVKSGGLDLGSYSSLEAGGTQIPGKPVVIPGNHAQSILWQIVHPTGPWPGGQRMPFGGPYLAAQDESTIAAWIDSLGATKPATGTATGKTK
jgi:menaquinol-cytochrome c reductase cytochrome b/c subunit